MQYNQRPVKYNNELSLCMFSGFSDFQSGIQIWTSTLSGAILPTTL